MFSLTVVVFSALLASSSSLELTFPRGFMFGAATAAYQVEGGWNVTDKGVSIWDHYTHHQPERIRDRTNGDVACDSYNQWRTDVQLVADLGLDHYRFSIAWARLMPTGFPNYISEDGKRYYSNIIDALLANGVQPMVTIYHWELPQHLQNLGGWTNPLIVDWFVDYVDVVLSLFGDRVKLWITINEPIGVCDVTFSDVLMAPGIYDPDHAMFICNKNVLLAHAKAWRLFHTKYKPRFGGKMSIGTHVMWYEGLTKESDDLAEMALQFCIGRYAHPIFSEEGGWPPIIEKIIADNSIKKGYSKSRLPAFSREEIELIKGTYDFFAFNHYTSRTVRAAHPGEKLRPWFLGDAPELNAKLGSRDEWNKNKGASSLYPFHPPGLRYALHWLKKNYGNLEYVITENGYSNTDHILDDTMRIEFIRDHLEQLLLAIYEDKINITCYTYWSLLDNFEWMDGYSVKFGLYEVDFEDPMRTRTPRKSAYFYRSVTDTRSIAVPLVPDSWLVAQMYRVTNGNSITNKHSLWTVGTSLILLMLQRLVL